MQKRRYRTVAIGICISLVLALFLIVSRDRSARIRKAEQEEDLVRGFLAQKNRPMFSEKSVIGMVWQAESADGAKSMYWFNPDGSLSETVVTPSGTTSAGLKRWQVDGGELVIMDSNGVVRKRYKYLGAVEGKVYVQGSDGAVESFELAK